MSEKQIQPPDPDVEEQTGATLNAHHVALSYLVGYMKAEADEDAPVAISACARIWQGLKGLFFHPGAKPLMSEPPAARYEHAQELFPLFLKSQKEKAKPVLANMIRNEKLPEHVRRNAARILGEHVGRRLHKERLEETQRWLSKHDL